MSPLVRKLVTFYSKYDENVNTEYYYQNKHLRKIVVETNISKQGRSKNARVDSWGSKEEYKS